MELQSSSEESKTRSRDENHSDVPGRDTFVSDNSGVSSNLSIKQLLS